MRSAAARGLVRKYLRSKSMKCLIRFVLKFRFLVKSRLINFCKVCRTVLKFGRRRAWFIDCQSDTELDIEATYVPKKLTELTLFTELNRCICCIVRSRVCSIGLLHRHTKNLYSAFQSADALIREKSAMH